MDIEEIIEDCFLIYYYNHETPFEDIEDYLETIGKRNLLDDINFLIELNNELLEIELSNDSGYDTESDNELEEIFL